MRKATGQDVLGQFGDGLQQRQGHVHADDRGGLEEVLLLRRQLVHACREHRLDGVRHHEGWRMVALGHDGPRQLLQKEGIARRFPDNLLLQRVCEGRRLPHGLHDHRLSRAVSPGSASCVAEDFSNQGGRYPGR